MPDHQVRKIGEAFPSFLMTSSHITSRNCRQISADVMITQMMCKQTTMPFTKLQNTHRVVPDVMITNYGHTGSSTSIFDIHTTLPLCSSMLHVLIFLQDNEVVTSCVY